MNKNAMKSKKYKKNKQGKQDKNTQEFSFLMKPGAICFTDEDKDLVSQDFCFEKEVIKKKRPRKRKVEELEKPSEDNAYDLTDKQKLMVQKNTIIKERLLTIDKILEMYPNLKKDKKDIVDGVLGKREIKKKDYILEKLNVKGKNFYKDEFGNVMNDKVDLIGFWTEDKNSDGIKKTAFMFFNEIKRAKAKLYRNKRKVDKMCLAKSVDEINIKNIL